MNLSNILLNKSTPESRQTPLISANAIYDTDIGVIKLIKKEYLDKSVFNLDTFKKYSNTHDLIRYLYYRKCYNPLYLFANNNVSLEMLDEYYKQFLERRMDTILDLCVSTELFQLIPAFNKTKEIYTTILYYNDEQKNEIKKCNDLDDNKLIHISELNSKIISENYSQIFIKDIKELDLIPLDLSTTKTFYISSFRPNFESTSTMAFKSTDSFMNIVKSKNNHHISIFDLYNESIIFHTKEQLNEYRNK